MVAVMITLPCEVHAADRCRELLKGTATVVKSSRIAHAESSTEEFVIAPAMQVYLSGPQNFAVKPRQCSAQHAVNLFLDLLIGELLDPPGVLADQCKVSHIDTIFDITGRICALENDKC